MIRWHFNTQYLRQRAVDAVPFIAHNLVPFLLPMLCSLLVTYLHFLYTAAKATAVLGWFLSLVGLPILVCFGFSVGMALLLNQQLSDSKRLAVIFVPPILTFFCLIAVFLEMHIRGGY